jgi:predicted enzyme related to lactoylglutathione lyase
MEAFQSHQPGTFSWVDLATIGAEGAKTFYTGLFGWEAEDTPAGPDLVYTMLKLEGRPVAGLYEMNPEQKNQGVPPHWMSYVTVENADAVAEKAKGLQGNIIAEPFDVSDFGRMALIQDPTGAILAVWQPKAHIGTHFKNVPGSLCWNELATNDTQKAEDFFTKFFGWEAQTEEMIGITYTSFKIGEMPVAGMYRMGPELAGIPSHWMPYFSVDDCDAIVERAKGLGAEVLSPPKDIPDTGRFAVLKDPQGAAVAVIKMIPMD